MVFSSHWYDSEKKKWRSAILVRKSFLAALLAWRITENVKTPMRCTSTSSISKTYENGYGLSVTFILIEEK